MLKLSRRSFVITGGAAIAGGAALAFSSQGARVSVARASTEQRFVFIIQRGAADGLATLAPVGDPAFAAQRGVLARDFDDAAPLDGMFALHPSLREIGGLYAANQALFAHAVASPYRERSHFDGQNVLETGGEAAYAMKDGWLNRLLALLPEEDARAIAVAATMPMALRGPVQVSNYSPAGLPEASDDLMARVSLLYAEDPQLHAVWEQALATRLLAGDLAPANGRNAAASGALAGRLLAGEEGLRIAMIETGGWDTHAGQRPRLTGLLRSLDGIVGALKQELGPAWAHTLVLVATEFGRTAKVNGSQGTDHGTASLAMLLGGAVNGGRVIADWPGLNDAALLEERDLRPTLGLDRLVAGALAEHFALDPARLAGALFPHGGSAPLSGLVNSARAVA